jgi:hypothetical protein
MLKSWGKRKSHYFPMNNKREKLVKRLRNPDWGELTRGSFNYFELAVQLA